MHIHTGLHYIPLRTPSGEYASHIGIFVKIAMNKLNPEQASSRGMCLLQSSKPPTKGYSSSWLFETCKISLGIIEEDPRPIAVEECKLEKPTSTCLLSNNTDDGNSTEHLLYDQPNMVKQTAVEFTVDISTNSSNDATVHMTAV